MRKKTHNVLNHSHRLSHLTRNPLDIHLRNISLPMLHLLQHLRNSCSYLPFN
jgi:hypothetical protein